MGSQGGAYYKLTLTQNKPGIKKYITNYQKLTSSRSAGTGSTQAVNLWLQEFAFWIYLFAGGGTTSRGYSMISGVPMPSKRQQNLLVQYGISLDTQSAMKPDGTADWPPKPPLSPLPTGVKYVDADDVGHHGAGRNSGPGAYWPVSL